MPIKDTEKKRAAQKRADEKRAGRTRNFATVVYPESAPADWLDRLDNYHVAALVSPLHDRDINPSGEQKKPHFWRSEGNICPLSTGPGKPHE